METQKVEDYHFGVELMAEQAVRSWLVARLAEAVGVEPAEIDVRQPFESYGLSSRDAVSLSGDLEELLQRRLSPTLVWEYPTIEELAKYLAASQVAAGPTQKRVSTPHVTEEAEMEPEPQQREQPAPGGLPEPIAIIGIGCRFPGAEGPEAFWQLLRNGVDAITEVPSDRWDVDAFYDPDPAMPGKMNTRWGGFVSGIDQFDPQFFGISPREATRIDPQQRLLLEVAWRALEDAGQVPERLAGTRTGVFIGISGNEYGQIQLGAPSLIDAYAGTGNALSIAANRISYVYDFQGPSVAVDTACSSSLVAIHLACCSLWSGESTLALAGGVNLILSPAVTINFTKAGAMAPDGRCKTFDARANGYVRGEGAGMVVLKPLGRALADGDPIYAVIRSTAVNQDGRTNGLMAPNPHAQEAVLREAYRRAGISPGQVQYVEAHGTGTLLGDPIEAKALGAVLATDRSDGSRCAIGSVKTNIGHLEAAAGVAGVIKTALALKHRELPPSLHFQQPNPHIPFDELPLYVQRSLTPWPETSGPAIAEGCHFAGVSSFGFGGTNAHVVLAEAPRVVQAREPEARESTPHVTDGRAYLLPLSAQNAETLQLLAQAYRDFLAAPPPVPSKGGEEGGASLSDLCYTASVRRSHHDYRLAVVGHSREELAEHLPIGGLRLQAFGQGEARPGLSAGRHIPGQRHKVAFVFPGQGAQWLGMGRQLLAQEPVFRQALEECEAALRPYVEWSLLAELTADEASSHLEQIDVVQPVLFAIQVSLAALWRSWGVEPDAVVGHSMGEVAAAHVAGALSLEDAVRVICHRSRLLKRTSGQGAMVAVGLTMEQARAALAGYEDRLCVAVSNSPTSTVLSGDPGALAELVEKFQRQEVFCRWVKVDVAAHSPYVDPLRPELMQVLAGLQPRPASIPIYSTVTGEVATQPLDPAYWGRNLREPVLFSAAVQRLLDDGYSTFVELSPHPILLSAIQQGMQRSLPWRPVQGDSLRQSGHEGTVLPSLRRQEDERGTLLGSLGALYSTGYPVAWERLYPEGGQYVALPRYPWQRERYWFEGAKIADSRWPIADSPSAISHLQSAIRHPLLVRHVQLADRSGKEVWEGELGVPAAPYLADHRVRSGPHGLQGAVVLPAAAYLEMALAAAGQALGSRPYRLEEIAFTRALVLPEEGTQTVQLVVSAEQPDQANFQFFSRQVPEEPWVVHAHGTIRIGQVDATPALHAAPAEIQARCAEVVASADYYQALRELGLEYGPSFQGIEQLWRRDGEALARLHLPDQADAPLTGIFDYQVHPALLDACFQTLAAALPTQGAGDASAQQSDSLRLYLPVGLGSLRLYGRPGGELWGHALLRGDGRPGGDSLEGDLFLLDDNGQVVLEALGLRVQRVEDPRQGVGGALRNLDEWLYQIRWERSPLPHKERPSASERPGGWLIFADAGDVGSALTTQLAAQGQVCVMVTPGEAYRVVDVGQYQLNPERPEEFRQLLKDVFGPGQPPCRGIVHLWSLGVAGTEQTDLASLAAAESLGCASVLHLVQAVAQAGWRDAPRLWLVTGGAQAVGADDESVAVAQAPLWGFGRTIFHEHPELRCTLVDLSRVTVFDRERAPGEAESLFAELWADGTENQVALRDGSRYVARLVRYAPPTPQSDSLRQAAAEAPALFQSDSLRRADGTYLLTGGLGGLGLTVARWMVEQGARHLLLLGRSVPSPAAQQALEAMQQAGAQIVVAQADVSQPQQMAEALAPIGDTMPPLRGVIHAAGILDDGILLQLNQARFRSVMAPKVDGAWNLHVLTAEAPLDFFVLFSSAASLFGSPGQGNYSAANAFLDALAHYRRAQGQPALSINWGPWAAVGLAARPDRGGRLAAQGLGSISPQEGVAVLARLLRHDSAQVGVLPLNLRQLLRPGSAQSPLLSHLIQEAGPVSRSTERPRAVTQSAGLPEEGRLTRAAILTTVPDERLALIETYLRELGARILGIPAARLDVHLSLIDMGLDSLMAVEVKRHVEADLEVVVPVVQFLQGPTIKQLAMSLLEQLSDSLRPPNGDLRLADASTAPSPVQVSGGTDVAQQGDSLRPAAVQESARAEPIGQVGGSQPLPDRDLRQSEKPGSWLSRLRGKGGRKVTVFDDQKP